METLRGAGGGRENEGTRCVWRWEEGLPKRQERSKGRESHCGELRVRERR